LVGALGLSAALSALLLVVSKGASWGWASGTTLGLFAAAVVVFAAWRFYELRAGQPLVDLRSTARPQVLFTSLAALAFGERLQGHHGLRRRRRADRSAAGRLPASAAAGRGGHDIALKPGRSFTKLSSTSIRHPFRKQER
jgi:hypothetical protein